MAPRNGDVVVPRRRRRARASRADERDVIFEPFARGASANGSRGAGLGLAIARGFLEVNGGRLWLEPANGHGATFAFALPSVRGPGVSGARVLVVDDEPQILRALRAEAAERRLRRRHRGDREGGARAGGDAPAGGGHPRPAPAGRQRHRRRAASCARGRRRRSSSSRRSEKRRRRSRRSTPAPTTT